MVPAGLADESLKEKALSEPKVRELLKDKAMKKIIVVKGRLVNIVI